MQQFTMLHAVKNVHACRVAHRHDAEVLFERLLLCAGRVCVMLWCDVHDLSFERACVHVTKQPYEWLPADVLLWVLLQTSVKKTA